MRDTTVAARYAQALFLVTEKRKETAHALEDLKGVGELVRPDASVGRLLETPQVLLSDKRKVLSEGLRGRVLPAVAVFVDLLLRKKRLGEFAGIVEQFEARVEKAQGVRRATVTSAVPLSKKELERLHAELERYTRAKIKLTSATDPSLLGGAMVRIGDRVVDRSVSSLLASITEHLAEASV